MKQVIGYEFHNNSTDVEEFLKDLPHKLKIEVSLFIHEERYKNIGFLKNKTNNFISWICPLLRP